MIIAQRKPFEELKTAVEPYGRVLVVGCGTCVAICLAGGEKEAGILAAQLDIASQLAGRDRAFDTACVERQCDREFLADLDSQVGPYEALLSLACGAGIQFLAERYPDKPVLAGVDTTFIGVNENVGIWDEKCRACRECVLSQTGGICPMTLCPKGLLNGPCGGTVNGHCEVDPEKECAWSKIYHRLELEGRLDNIREILPLHPHDRCTSPGTVIHPAYKRRYGINE